MAFSLRSNSLTRIIPFGLAWLLNLSVACAQKPRLPDISEVLQHIEADRIRLELVEQALPRRTEEVIIFRLRGGDPAALRGAELNQETAYQKCIIIGAYMTAALWDWQQFMGSRRPGAEITQLKFVMEHYLMQVNHRLRQIEAPRDLLSDIDKLKEHFEASEENVEALEVKTITERLKNISKTLEAFMLTDNKYDRSYALGQWLVWQAELSNLCLASDHKSFPYLRQLMNRTYRIINLETYQEFAPEFFQTANSPQTVDLKKALMSLDRTYLIKSRDKCDTVQKSVAAIFDVFELKFPSLKM